MENNKYLDDLKDIKDIMNRSTKFLSLSGMSGVSAGLIALAGAFSAYSLVFSQQDLLQPRSVSIGISQLYTLLIIAFSTLILALSSGVFFTYREAKKKNQRLWNDQVKRFLVNVFIPLVTGGVLCMLLLARGYIGILSAMTLIFYGLALVNASKYTHNEIRSLGLIEICLGLFAISFPGYGLQLWAVGFGVLHIVYGIIMHFKYNS